MIAPLARLLLRGALIALPVLLIAGGWWLLDSEAGVRFALARADRALGGGLSVTHAAGRLAGPLDLEGVTLVHQGTRVEIATLHLDLHPAPLLLGRLQLITFIARGVRVHTTPDLDPPPLVLPARIDLPFHIALEHFTIEDLVIGVGARAPLQFDRVSGAASADARGLRLDELEVGTAAGGLRGHLALGLAQPYPVDGLLTLDLSRPARPSIVSATLGGRLEALEISATSPAPLAASAELTLRDPLNSPQLAGTASCTALQLAALDPALAALTGATLDCSLKLEATGAATRVRGRLRYRQPGLAPANLDLTLEGVNLTNQANDQYISSTRNSAVVNNITGREYVIGIRYKF